MITYKEIRNNEEVRAYYQKGDQMLGLLGYTDHSMAHATKVAEQAANILAWFDYDEEQIELVRIAGIMHDIGNAINREHHGEYGALLANQILHPMDISIRQRITIVSAIANHDESTGRAIDPVSAALIIADKTDVRRNRVRTDKKRAQFDIHDRVNFAVVGAHLKYQSEKKSIDLNLQIDEEICTMYEYFEIFLGRMIMCRRAAELLGTTFRLIANGQKVL